MKNTLLAIIFLLGLFSCKKQSAENSTDEIRISQRVHFKEDRGNLLLNSDGHTYQLSKKDLPLDHVIVLNASLIGYFSELDLEDKIIGVSSPEYIYSNKIQEKVANEHIANVGSEQKYDIEKILALKPDAIFTNYIASFENTYAILEKNGIKILFFNEYLEEKPLEKTAYLKVFGYLFGVESKADSLYTNIAKEYNRLKLKAKSAKEKPMLIANEMYGNQWFVPGGKSFMAQLFEDANANYPWSQSSETGSIPLSFEEVYAKSTTAQYWVNLSDYKTKSSLLAFNNSYALLNPYKNGKIYSIGKRAVNKTNDYFESGVVRADKVLQDYINIFHPGLCTDSTLIYMKELR